MLVSVKRWLAFGMLVALALAAWLWLARRSAPGAPELPVPASEAPAAPPRPSESVTVEPESRRKQQSSEPQATQAPAQPAFFQLTLRFVDPGRSALHPQTARVRLTDPEGRSVEVTSNGSDSVRFERVEGARQIASVDAPGFVHRPQTLELQATGLTEDLVLWPQHYVAVVVVTPEGKPLRELAGELGIEPRHLFYRAFEARAYPEELPADDTAPEGGQAPPAEFCPPPTYTQWEICESVVGALKLREPPPMWVSLDLLGQRVGMEHLEPGQKEVVFHLPLPALESKLARLQLRVLEGQTDDPARGAKVTLRADTAPYRRPDQENVPTRDDGTLEFARIVPGRYELVVERGDALYQDRIELAAGATRDLGTIRLTAGAALRIRVVDERGEPQQAWLEIAPYEPGKSVGDLYPPMLHEVTSLDGTGKLPMPARVSIVRAQQMIPRGLSPSGRMSANVRVDPAFPPTGELRLVIPDQALVRIACNLPEARTLQLIDGSGLIVLDDSLSSERWKEGRRKLEIGRGQYELRLRGADGALLYQRVVELHAGEQDLEIP